MRQNGRERKKQIASNIPIQTSSQCGPQATNANQPSNPLYITKRHYSTWHHLQAPIPFPPLPKRRRLILSRIYSSRILNIIYSGISFIRLDGAAINVSSRLYWRLQKQQGRIYRGIRFLFTVQSVKASCVCTEMPIQFQNATS